eukprot:3158777-Pyramimonas_sp.AAC.1
MLSGWKCQTKLGPRSWMHTISAGCSLDLLRYSDGEGALNNDTAKAVIKTKGTELRMRARGQRATMIEARNGILRHLLRVMEAEPN